MWRIALKSTLANRSRFVLTGIAIALSVAFMTATLILSDSMAGTAADDIAAANAGVDAVVEGNIIAEDDGGPGEMVEISRETLAASTVARLESAEGVVDAVGVITGFAKLVEDGQPVGSGLTEDIGQNWVTNPDMRAFVLAEGTAPRSAGEIAIDRAVADDAGLAVGDRLQVLTATGLHDATVTGIAGYGPADAAPGTRTTFFADTEAADVLGQSGFSRVLVELQPGLDPTTVIESFEALLPEESVVTGAEFIADRQDAVTTPLEFVSIFLVAFAAIATAVGISIIYNTFAIAMVQRRREMALLRALGAERRQVMRSVMIEAALIGTVASALGLGLGVVSVSGLRTLMTSLGLSFLTGPTIVSTTTVVTGAALGLLVTLASAWAPARHASATAPIEALRRSATETTSGSNVRGGIGLVCLGLGVAGMIAAAMTKSTVLLTTSALLVPGLILAGPVIVHAIVRLAHPVLTRLTGVEGSIASKNLDRNPRRAASTSLALTMGVALLGFFAILASSLSASVAGDLKGALDADHVVTSLSSEFATIDPGLAGRVRDIDGVTAAAPVAQVEATVNGESATIAGIDPAAMGEVFDFGTVEGSLAQLDDGGVAVVADDQPPPSALGDLVEVRLGGGITQLTVVAIVSNSLGGFDAPSHFISHAVLDAEQEGLLDTVIYLSLADEAVVGEVRSLVAATPGSLLQSGDSYVANVSTEVDSFRNFIYSLLALTLVIALVGIANTTTLSISERTREIGLLRAVGATGRTMRRIIRLEATLLAVTGTLIGLLSAFVAGWAIIETTGGTDIPGVSVPWLSLGVIGLGAIAAGTAAAAYPAWRASRTPILAAISSE